MRTSPLRMAKEITPISAAHLWADRFSLLAAYFFLSFYIDEGVPILSKYHVVNNLILLQMVTFAYSSRLSLCKWIAVSAKDHTL